MQGKGSGVATAERTRADTDLVIVTGVSGGGRSTVARALENVGFYVVDNLPQRLLLDMAELAFAAGEAGRRTAMVLDVRSRAFSIDLAAAVRALREVVDDVEADVLQRPGNRAATSTGDPGDDDQIDVGA